MRDRGCRSESFSPYRSQRAYFIREAFGIAFHGFVCEYPPSAEQPNSRMKPQEAIDKLQKARAKVSQKVALYPYSSFSNVEYVNRLLALLKTDFQQLIADKRIVDIGCGDGDVSFICEMLGAKEVTAIDWADTNYNFMQGVRALSDCMGSNIQIHSGNLEDLDLSFLGIRDLIFFLGILYHLPNPIRVLRKLSVMAHQIVASTRVFDVLPETPANDLRKCRVAYLLEPAESNNDISNWWTPTEAAVTTMFERAGWRVVCSLRSDEANGRAEPFNPKFDGRLFLVANSVYV
jgi:tRNA (mo5U34)-methyltransferase